MPPVTQAVLSNIGQIALAPAHVRGPATARRGPIAARAVSHDASGNCPETANGPRSTAGRRAPLFWITVSQEGTNTLTRTGYLWYCLNRLAHKETGPVAQAGMTWNWFNGEGD